MGLLILVIGVAFVYYTYANTATAGIAPEIITVNYALGLLLSVVGLFATFAKFK